MNRDRTASARFSPRPSPIALTAGLTVLCGLSLQALAGAHFQASPPLDEALGRAQADNRRLVLLIGSTHCPDCRSFEAELGAPEVLPRLMQVLRLTYWADQGEGIDVARRFNVVTVPTLLLLDPHAMELGRLTGRPASGHLSGMLDDLLKGRSTPEALEKRLGQRPLDGAMRLRLGTLWAERGDRMKARQYLDPLVSLAAPGQTPRSPEQGEALAARALWVRGQVLELRSLGDHAAAQATLTELRSRFPRSPEAEQAVAALAEALLGLGQRGQALTLLEKAATTVNAHWAAAHLLLHAGGLLAPARAHARQALAQDPEHDRSWGLLAEIEAEAGDLPAALLAINRALSADPKNIQYKQKRELWLRRLSREPAGPRRPAPRLPDPGATPRAPVPGR